MRAKVFTQLSLALSLACFSAGACFASIRAVADLSILFWSLPNLLLIVALSLVFYWGLNKASTSLVLR